VNRLLPKELDFIKQFQITNHALEFATWRHTDFDANVWKCSLGEKGYTLINFKKVLNDGSLLTDPKNKILLNNIKRFLCLQTHPALTGSISVSPKTAKQRIAIALHILDYFLLQGNYLDLAINGFRMVTKDDVIMLIDTISTNHTIKASIYQPVKRISSFLEQVKVSPKELASVRAAHPDLFEFEVANEDWVLPSDRLVNARAWLKLNDYYYATSIMCSSEYKYRVRRMKLLKHIIGNRVLGVLKFDRLCLEGLDVAPSIGCKKEFPAVPVSNFEDDERASSEFVASYISTLKSMRLALQYGIEIIPNYALTVLEDTGLLQNERTKERTRFTTLPFEVANSIFEKAIEFYIEYGVELVDYYLALAATRENIRELPLPVPNKLKKLGITAWRLSVTPDEFFKQLRSGSSLFNMLEVLYGAIGIIVNTLMARRASELEDLTQESIVEEAGSYFLAFNLRKANVLEHRQRMLRPLPHLGAEALKLLARLSHTLQELDYTTDRYLFSIPISAWISNSTFYGTRSPDLKHYLNRFCDFFQTPTDDQGRRYYVRAHQLRRNFAMLFFWKGSFGGIEVLRYFLGHKNPSMTYCYVTETIPGKILRRVKATVAKDMIRVDHEATAGLAQLICERYGLTLSQLYILPERDVVDYIEDLISTGEAEVEPEFIEGPHGEEYRIIYRIIDKSMHKVET
jgi:hypothetical protein